MFVYVEEPTTRPTQMPLECELESAEEIWDAAFCLAAIGFLRSRQGCLMAESCPHAAEISVPLLRRIMAV